eukprot:3942615-Amphidinium_carterae.1
MSFEHCLESVLNWPIWFRYHTGCALRQQPHIRVYETNPPPQCDITPSTRQTLQCSFGSAQGTHAL